MNDKSRKNVSAGRKHVRQSIVMKLLIFTLITAVIVLGYYHWFPSTLSNFLARFLRVETIDLIRNWKIPIAVIMYLVGCVLICVYSSTKYLKNMDLIASSVMLLTEEEQEIPIFPEELKDVEIALRDAQYDIAKAKRLSAENEQQKNELLTFLAHDLRTPLTSVLGYINLLQENRDMPAEQRNRFIDIAADKSERLEELLNEFFDITRMNLQTMELSRQEVDVTMMLYQIADEFYPVLAERDLTAELTVESSLKCSADPDKLARVFDNLLRNAAAYAYAGTVVQLSAGREDDSICIEIRNQGDEVPPEKLELMFKKFYRGDSSRSSRTGGAGLGLAIAREIVELHGGSISVRSVGHEMRFRISLPITAPA